MRKAKSGDSMTLLRAKYDYVLGNVKPRITVLKNIIISDHNSKTVVIDGKRFKHEEINTTVEHRKGTNEYFMPIFDDEEPIEIAIVKLKNALMSIIKKEELELQKKIKAFNECQNEDIPVRITSW